MKRGDFRSKLDPKPPLPAYWREVEL